MCVAISVSLDQQHVKINYNYIWNIVIHGLYPLSQLKNINQNNTTNTVSTEISSAPSTQTEYC
jgi:hypothetical protein